MYATPRHTSNAALIDEHMELVRRIAYHLLGRLPASVQSEDLIQAGVIGLLEAAQNYDASHNASFETYAGIRIRGAMLDEVRRLDWAPRSTHRTTRELTVAIQAVERRTGRAATAQEIADELGIDIGAYHKMLRKVTEGRVFSLEALFGSDSDFAETLECPADDPARAHLREGFTDAARRSLAELPEREQLVLSMYYHDELNLKEIGEVLGVTESRVCQIHGQALARLRARLVDWD